MSETTPEGGTGTTETGSPATTDAGKTFTQADVDRVVTERLARERSKFADYDDLKSKAEQFSALEAASRTDQERAVEEARKAARAETLKENAPRLVAAEFRAAAAGKLTGEQLSGLLEDLDLTKYLTDKGDVDIERVGKRVASLATAPERPFPDLGGGKRGATTKATDMNSLIRSAAGYAG